MSCQTGLDVATHLKDRTKGISMKSYGLLFVAAMAALSACQSAPGPKAETISIADAILSGEDCPPHEGALLFWMDTPSVEIGEQVMLSPMMSPGPWYFENLPGGCLGGLIAAPEAAVNFSRTEDGTPLAEITSAAKTGQVIILSARYGKEGAISGQVNVYSRSENPLVGYWHQTARPDCSPHSRINELVFYGDGGFSVTWQPFESYKDYWGEYAYDAGTGTLFLTPEGGNYIPDDVTPGKIDIDGETLRLGEGFSFGSTSDGQACSAEFKRSR